VVVGAVLAGLAGIGLHGLAVWYEGDLPPVQSVEDYRKAALQTTRVFARDGRLVAELWRERRTLVAGDELPRRVREVAVAAEDGDFYQHDGVDPLGIVRAVVVNLRDQRFSQGASTITQQLARSFYLTADKTLERKLLEVFLARKLETHLDKGEILTLYLNQIYFGHGRWGIAEGARYYLGKTVAELSIADAALLMALVPAPERLNPFSAYEAAIERRDRIIRRMVVLGYATEAEAARHLRERPNLNTPGQVSVTAPWFVDVVKRRLVDALGLDAVMTGGLRVYTTVDLDAQASVDAAMKSHLGDAPSSPEGALVIIDPTTRAVRALSGGVNAAKSAFNRAIQAHRQAGSTVKPFVYGAAFERGVLHPESELDNKSVCYRGARGPWCPRNANGQHDGTATTISEALTRSLNVIAVQALRQVGISAFTDFIRRAGVRSPVPPDLTAALGSGEVTPLELTNAYATLAAGGVFGEPIFVRRVEDVDGRIVYAEREAQRRVVPAAVAETLTRMLTAVVAEGTGRRARIDGLDVAGKTGTTSGRVDAWFVGYTVPGGPDQQAVVAGVWVGHDDNTSLVAGSGGKTAAPLWADAVRGWFERASRHAAAR
jgi:penicillin-binding protein 1A